MTEKDARTKWCPMVRLHRDKEGSWDNRGNDYHSQNCIGSDCMAWKWNITPKNADLLKQDNPKTQYVANGYCGLTR